MYRPAIRYDWDEGVWYVEVGGLKSWARSRAWANVLPLALTMATVPPAHLHVYLLPVVART